MENMDRWCVIRLRHIRIGDDSEFDFWSNDMGWVDFHSATFFDFAEIEELYLPIDGAWLPVRRAYGIFR